MSQEPPLRTEAGGLGVLSILIIVWVVIGIGGLGYAIWRAQPSRPRIAAPIGMNTAEKIPYVEPGEIEAPPIPPESPPEGRIIDVRIAADARGSLDAVSDQRNFAGGPTPVGIVIRHQGFTASDSIVVELYIDGVYASACPRQVLNSMVAIDYWCQFPSVRAGRGRFRVIINGTYRASHDFVVAGPPQERPPAPQPQDERGPKPQPPSTRPAEPAFRGRGDARSPPDPEESVVCILPTGQEIRAPREACRRQSGVIY